jgi:hypothetical protein
LCAAQLDVRIQPPKAFLVDERTVLTVDLDHIRRAPLFGRLAFRISFAGSNKATEDGSMGRQQRQHL